MNSYTWCKLTPCALLTICIPSAVMGQSDSGRYRMEPYSIESGIHSAPPGEAKVMFRHVVRVSDAQWLRLRFGDYNLGKRSYIIITSLEDGDWQRLDAGTLPQWGNATGFFRGGAVEVELHVELGDRRVRFRIEGVAIGEAEEGADATRTICGNDDRQTSSDNAIGRLVFNTDTGAIRRCTAWIVSNGAHLTAGHCAPRNVFIEGTLTAVMPAIMEFNVRPSSTAGTPTPSLLNDQYPIIQGSIVAPATTVPGDDWAVFDCRPNSNTLLLPVQAQRAYKRMARTIDLSPDTSSNSAIRLTGNGTDTTPTAQRNRVQQTDVGPYIGLTWNDWSNAFVEYAVDSMSGNSGGPILGNVAGADLGTHAIGIHTNGGCNPTAGNGNTGTSFENTDLESAIQTFPGPNVLYVDKGHNRSWVQQNGTIFRPFFGVNGAVSGAPAGALISIVKGSYPDPFSTGWRGETFTLEAPVGSVVIGD